MNLDKIKKSKPIRELLDFSIINMDKPSGPTSFQTDEKIKNWLGLKKTSHFGTLDPKVTGVLPIALNRACKLSDYFMHKDKTYVGIIHLHSEITEKKLEEEMKKFVGKIKQLPPVKSRVKRQERTREVKRFEIIEKKEKDVLFIAEVEAGTYIRKLCSDLGEGVGGAHMTELRRTKASIFSEEDKNFISLYDLQLAIEEYRNGNEEELRKILIPAEIITKILPVVQVSNKCINQLLTGKPLMKGEIIGELPDSEKFIVFLKDRFIEVARKSNEGDIIARPDFVLN